MKHLPLFFLSLLFVFAGCQRSQETFQPNHQEIRFAGRVDLSNPAEPLLIGSASSVEMAFVGDSVQVSLKKLNPADEPNYISLELDGEYLERIRLVKDTMEHFSIGVPASAGGKHILKIYKATEAQNGYVVFGGVRAQELRSLPPMPERTIEFIGNSITCGMGVDYNEIPCDSGVWYDQHNAYMAYGPRVARELEAQYMVSCVSGIGMYRNWNSNPGEEPVMPEVYPNRYFNTDTAKAWDFSSFQPELVSIALGTNDFSDGDGSKERLPFDSATYVAKYIDFVNTLYSKYPNTQITLLTSPMVTGEKGVAFLNSLKAVQEHFRQNAPNKKPIAVFNFEPVTPHGCGYHPDQEDQRLMAEQLLPFYKKVMSW